MKTKLSVNVNKVATLRNARGGNTPNLVQVALDCVKFGADGITVHPRPDARHIRYQDVRDLAKVLTVEFNIEGYPSKEFLDLIDEVRPAQATFVPDPPDAITSNAGWDCINNKDFLKGVALFCKERNIRSSFFMDCDLDQIDASKTCGVDRIELYTEAYADGYKDNKEYAIKPYQAAAFKSKELGLGLNAGHDLNLKNLKFFDEQIDNLLEVSIGHALISDALYFGLDNTINMYKQCLK